MIFKVIISDRAFVVKEQLDAKIGRLAWDYNRIGGCGGFSFELPIEYCTDRALGVGFNIKIYRRNPSTDAFDLWYQGKIESKANTVNGTRETIRLSGQGYQSALRDIYVDRDYSSTEVSVIVKSILDNDITPNTDITYSGGDIEATGFTADTLEFNTDAQSAMQTLADLVGTREWGVDKDRKFFFKARSSSTGFRYPLGAKVLDFSLDQTSSEIINRAVIRGGDISGTPFTATYNDLQSQAKWNRRDSAIQNSAIVTSAVASQFADALFAEFSETVRRGRVRILDDIKIEDTIPIPLLEIVTRRDTYGTRKYGTGLYNGPIPLQVNRVSYRVDETSNLIVDMNVGQLRPSISESISQIEHKIDQLRAVGV